MRTLLVCLACVVLMGCAKPVPPGMEKMGDVDEFVYNATCGEHCDANRSARTSITAEDIASLMLQVLDTSCYFPDK